MQKVVLDEEVVCQVEVMYRYEEYFKMGGMKKWTRPDTYGFAFPA